MASSSSSSPEISAAPTRHTPDNSSYKYSSIDEVLEDLSSRFILNLPDEELTSLERVCFQVEQAHWFYEDFVREENPKFPSLPLKRFSALLFHACPLLRQWSHDHEQAFNNFMQYKTRVPVCGAIMLSDTWDKCILVKGWKSSSGWGFPKGKINQDEEPHKCAVREVLEETGYDLSGQIDPEDVIEMSIREQKISLYIVAGIPEDYPFKTRTRKEISRIEWFKLTDLPTWKRNKAVPGKFYLISPFIGALKAFINERRPRHIGRKTRARDMHVRQGSQIIDAEGEHIADVHSHIIVGDDRNTQESSSSSSTGNGGPDTPSPQWSESVATQVEIDGNSEPAIPSFDPDLARLLNALSLSAQGGANTDNKAKPAFTPLSLTNRSHTHSPILPASTTPVPITTSSIHSHPLPEASDQPDWSACAPRPLAERQGSPPPNRDLQRSSPWSGQFLLDDCTFRSSARPGQPPPPLSISSLSHVPHVPSGPLSAALSSGSTASRASMSSTSVSRPAASRRGSSTTADISPYLSRPSEIPASGKRLKQLALLETVADESARMTPALEHRASVTSAHALASHRYSVASGPSMSVSPMAHILNSNHINHVGFNDARVIYSSGSSSRTPPTFPVISPPPSAVAPSFHPTIQSDPFQVRPQTSHSFHPGHGPSYPPQFSHGRTSMHEKQLLASLNGTLGNVPRVLSAAPPQPAQRAFHGLHPTYQTQPPLSGVVHSRPQHVPMPLQMPPSNLWPASLGSGPLSAPALSPHFDMMGQAIPHSTPASNARLLSILNARDPPRVGSASAAAVPGILNTNNR